MDNSTIQTLEAAAQMLMAPPNMVTSDQRHQAEGVFLEFRNTKNPYQMCRELLEKSSSDSVLFEAASLLKTALIREWSLLSDSDITSLRVYLLNYLMRKDTPPFLRDKLLQTIAIIVKRGSIDDSGRERRALLGELEKIILSAPINQQKLACSLILAIMQEYSITVKSADVGLMWEVHFRLKKSFEASDLKRIFRFSVSVLEQIVRSGHRPEGEQALLTKQLLMIVESILCWSYVSALLSKRLIGVFEAIHESDTTPALRLGMNWMDTIMKPELLSLFFELHMYVRSNPDLLSHSITCLIQLASLSGFADNLKKQYLDNYVNSFMNAMAYVENVPTDRELLGIADIYRRLNQFFKPACIAAQPPIFLQTLTTLTCHCIRGAVIEENVDDDTVWREALNKFLHTWSSLVSDMEGYFSNEVLLNPCIEIFNTYLQTRLAPPDGTRCADKQDEDIRDDLEEDERKLHSNNLLTIGAIARKAPAHCSHILFTLLQDRSKRLETQLQQMHMGKMQLSSGLELSSLFEDLHWILMITGHFLAIDCTEPETLYIPTELVQYSISENANVELSLTYLTGSNTNPQNVDPVLKLLGEIFRISKWECLALEAGLGNVFSPELSATISWLLKVWANSYLMINTADYSERMSVVLESAFGLTSAGVAWACGQLASRVATSLRHMHHQPAPAGAALSLLTTLASKNTLSQCEEFVALVNWEIAGSNLQGDLRRELHRAFALVSRQAEGPLKERLIDSTVTLQEKLTSLINMESDTEPIRNMLAVILDCFIGFSEGFREVESMDRQFMVLISVLEKIPGILFRYHNYPGVVLPALRLLSKSAKKMTISGQFCERFLEICDATFDVYQRWNSGKISNIPQDAEEEAYEDICALMELTCNIAQANSHRTTGLGLRVLLPLITSDLLALPTLANNAYRMLRVLESAEHFTTYPLELFNMVVAALRVGLTAVSSDVSSICCNTIASLADKLQNTSPYTMPLLTLAELLLILIIKMEMPADCIPAASAAIYNLTCLKPALLEGLARQMIEAFAANDPSNMPKLEEAFGILTNGVIFDRHRPHRIRFQDNFDKFLTSVHGFLIVK